MNIIRELIKFCKPQYQLCLEEKHNIGYMCKKIKIQVPNIPFQQASKIRAIKTHTKQKEEKSAEINQI